MIFRVQKYRTTYEALPVVCDPSLIELNKIGETSAGHYVYVSIDIPEYQMLYPEACLASTALYEGLKLIITHKNTRWRKDFGQI